MFAPPTLDAAEAAMARLRGLFPQAERDEEDKIVPITPVAQRLQPWFPPDPPGHRRGRVGRRGRELPRLADPGGARGPDEGLRSGAGRPPGSVARAAGDGQDLRPPSPGLGVAPVVPGPLHHGSRGPLRRAGVPDAGDGGDGAPPPPASRDGSQTEIWRLLVLEDTGEMLTPDAKSRVGQGLSRLLNLADGFIGQAVRVLVLVTSNDPLERLHEAIGRPGRCAAEVEFRPMSAAEGRAWLESRAGGEAVLPVEGSVTVAELYGLLEGG
jgi:hypothetical protein